MNKTILTQAGYDKLVTELDELKQKQTRLVTQIEEVAQPDESGEDGLATQLKDELEVINSKIEKIEEAFETVEIVNSHHQYDSVQIGTTVKIKILGNSEKEFSIVSHFESDPSTNKISDQSPLGQALIGKKINDQVEVDAPVGKITYKIIAIS
jgi:transcription elongation factor GreA